MRRTDPKLLSAKRIITARNDVGQPLQHTCQAKFCQPMSEMDLIGVGKLPGPVICRGLYVCKYRQLHMCEQGSCDDYMHRTNGTCQKTGIYHGHPDSGFMRNPTYKVVKNPSKSSIVARQRTEAYSTSGSFVRDEKTKRVNFAKAMVVDRAQPMEEEVAPELKRQKVEVKVEEEEEKEEEDNFWGQEYKRKQEKKRLALANPTHLPFRKKRELSERALIGQAKDVISDLFYSSTRDKINKDKRIAAAEGSKRQIKAYHQQRKEANAPWFIHDVLKIDANERLIQDHLDIPDREHYLVEYFSSVIVRAWTIVNASPWGIDNQGKIKFDQHCLGVLYYMRTGYTPHDVVYIPRHEYMMYLPLVNDLRSFGYPKNGVKSGMKVITYAYESARKAKWTNSQLRMENKVMNRSHGKVSKMYG